MTNPNDSCNAIAALNSIISINPSPSLTGKATVTCTKTPFIELPYGASFSIAKRTRKYDPNKYPAEFYDSINDGNWFEQKRRTCEFALRSFYNYHNVVFVLSDVLSNKIVDGDFFDNEVKDFFTQLRCSVHKVQVVNYFKKFEKGYDLFEQAKLDWQIKNPIEIKKEIEIIDQFLAKD